LNDGAHDWSLDTYYIDPRFQVKQLHDAGFANVRFFSLRSGTEIGSLEQLESNRDPWMFFLCKAKK
jgi:hypothetical protein